MVDHVGLQWYPKVKSLFEHPTHKDPKKELIVTSRESVFNSWVLQFSCNFRNLCLQNKQPSAPGYYFKRSVSIATGLFSISTSLTIGLIEVVIRVAIGVITALLLFLPRRSWGRRLVLDLGFRGAKTTFCSVLHGLKVGSKAISSEYHELAIESYRKPVVKPVVKPVGSFQPFQFFTGLFSLPFPEIR